MNIRSGTSLDDDAGLSLIELIIYILIIGVIGTLIMMLFINMWQTERSVKDQTAATTRGQLVSSQIERAMRNAVAFSVTDGGATLKVATSLSGAQQCQGFHFTDDGALMTISNAPSGDPTSWPEWQDRLEQVASYPFFAEKGTNGVTYSFDAIEPDAKSAPVRFTGDVHMRNASAGTLSPCW